jgi:hypothetical protein
MHESKRLSSPIGFRKSWKRCHHITDIPSTASIVPRMVAHAVSAGAGNMQLRATITCSPSR